MAMPIGRLTKKPARHEIQAARAPPTTRPRLAPMPAVAAYQATARLRSLPAGKLAVSSEREAGATMAAPPPADDVAGPRPEQEQAAEDQRVGVLHPRQLTGRQVHRGADARQPGEDHR